jgi:uncharacterized OB-fold protein
MTDVLQDRIEESPRATYLAYAAQGILAYQRASDGRAVFYPRLAQPGTGDTDLHWAESAGLGTVYAATTVRPRDGEPYNVSMIEIDEGFRLMSAVVDAEPGDVRIGARVSVVMRPLGADGALLPVFELIGNTP